MHQRFSGEMSVRRLEIQLLLSDFFFPLLLIGFFSWGSGPGGAGIRLDHRSGRQSVSGKPYGAPGDQRSVPEDPS